VPTLTVAVAVAVVPVVVLSSMEGVVLIAVGEVGSVGFLDARAFKSCLSLR